MSTIPLGLRHAMETGQCILFLGSGIGHYAKDNCGRKAPTGYELAQELIDHFSLNIDYSTPLTDVAEIIEIRKGRKDLEQFLKSRLANLIPDDNLKWLFKLRWKAIYTTNYDNIIENTYHLIDSPLQNPISISITSELQEADTFYEVPIYHLHGSLFGVAEPKIIITSADYAQFRIKRKMLFELLKKDFATATIIYLGYSNKDYDWRIVLEEIKAEFFPSKLLPSYRIDPNSNIVSEEILSSAGISTLHFDLESFVKAAQVEIALDEVKFEANIINRIKISIPDDLKLFFDSNPPSIIRLLKSWEYVNQADFNTSSNIKQFINGDRPNWALIANKQYFERDIEEQVYDNILDYLTSPTKSPTIKIILGSAGYGLSTLLMILATKLVNDRVGAVFMHKVGTSILEGDIDYVSSIFPEKPIFFIDNAADNCETLNSIIQKFKESKRSGLFILGERINEWKQSRSKLIGREFELEELSDPEILRLLEFLEKNNMLNKLEDLPEDLKIAAIREKHNKQLLVAMKEATEGKSFDAIIEDEFRGISNEVARRLYLLVSCFYQHGSLIRDGLLAELLGKTLTDMYKETRDNVEGIVIYDDFGTDEGSYVARARHRIIAAIVWERCGLISDRDNLLQKVIESLNFVYKVDRDAFEFFYKSDHLIDSISTFEGRTKFFETACRKDPLNPYVRQHYARMLSRTDKHELAISQIDEAIKLETKSRILYHTKAKVLADLAMITESTELARRRLAQSEANYRICLSMYDRDEYAYQGLAELFFEWSKRVKDDQEKIHYISKSEEIISEGIKKAKFRDALWIVSSNIQDYLGNYPSSLQVLENAIKDNPSSIFAPYCLGRAYRKRNEPQKAKQTLEPIIKGHFEEYRIFIEYALAQLENKEPYKNIIAILELSSLYGYSDAKYIALLGGLKTLNKDFEESTKIFEESLKHPFTAQELSKIYFRPLDYKTNEPLRIEGKVIKVRAGYALIENNQYPVFLCPGSKFNGLILKEGMKITFEVTFCAKGSIADKPVKIE